MRLGNYQFATWKLLVCDLETMAIDYQQVTKAPEKVKLFVNFLDKTRRVNMPYFGSKTGSSIVPFMKQRRRKKYIYDESPSFPFQTYKGLFGTPIFLIELKKPRF